MKHELTFRQRQALDCIRQSVAEKGYPPTLREIGDYMGLRSTNAVNDHLKALQKKGHIAIDRTLSRGIRLIGAELPTSEMQRLTDGIRRLAAVLGADLGLAGAPLPGDWLRRCIEAAQARSAA